MNTILSRWKNKFSFSKKARVSSSMYFKWWSTGIIRKFLIKNSSLFSKVESRKLAGALGSCFVLFKTLQQGVLTELDGNRARNCSTMGARSRLKISISAANDIARIIHRCLVYYTYTQRTDQPRNSRFPITWPTYCWFYTSSKLITQKLCK